MTEGGGAGSPPEGGGAGVSRSMPIIAHLSSDSVLTRTSMLRGDSEDSEDEAPPRTKASKPSGAAKYRTKFNPLWRREFTFIAAVPGDKYRLVQQLASVVSILPLLKSFL